MLYYFGLNYIQLGSMDMSQGNTDLQFGSLNFDYASSFIYVFIFLIEGKC